MACIMKIGSKEIHLSWTVLISLMVLIIMIISLFSDNASSLSEVQTKVNNLENDVNSINDDLDTWEKRFDDQNAMIIAIDTKVDILINKYKYNPEVD